MRVTRRVRPDFRFTSTVARFGFAVAAVALAFVIRVALSPLTGHGAPYVLFFAAMLLTGLFAGGGPALLYLAISLPLATAMFVVPTGAPVPQAVFQAALYAVDGFFVVYLAMRADWQRRSVYETIELAPDAYLATNVDARFVDVNQAACDLLGYERDELIRKTAFDIIPPEETARLKAIRAEHKAPGPLKKTEWNLLRKDGTIVPVEVSTNVLPDGRWQAFLRDISERKQIEDLRQVYVALLDNSSDFIGIADPAGKPLYLNPAGRRMIGLEPDSPIEQLEIKDVYPPELRDFATGVILKTTAEEGQWSGETEFQNFLTHEKVPVSDTHFLIRDASRKRVLGLGTVTRDISDARRVADEREQLLAHEQAARQAAESANAKLRESEERFRLTIDDAPIGMALVALSGSFVRVNQALCDILGYTADELTKLTAQSITRPDDVDKEVELAQKLARGKIPRYQLERRYIRKDGSTVDVMLSASVLRAQDGKARYYIAQVEDITTRKRAREALRFSEAKFSGIVSIAADAIISVDKDQCITLFNEGAEKIFGYTMKEAVGMPIERLLPERFRAVHGEHLARFFAGRETARLMGERREIFGLRKNGEEFPAEASISKVAVGGVTFSSVVLRDVTYRKSVEESLQRAVAARDEVLGVVAHDLRNPLSTILMQAQLLERPEPDVERRDPTARLVITRSAKRLNSLIQDLLDVATIEAGQLTVEHEPVSVPQLARDVVESQSPLADAAKLQLHVDIGDDVPDIRGDRNRLLRVFDNLISNAIKFTPEGGRVAVSADVKDGDVVFAIADTGSGIEPENLAHIFDRFWQAATRARRLGAGLGLPITKGIVEAHAGRIWVESVLGQGSKFFFSIPVAQPAGTAPTEKKRAGKTAPKSDTRRIRRERA